MKKRNNIIRILMIVAGIIFLVLSILLVTNNLGWIDTPVYNFISKYINPDMTFIMKGITSSCGAPFLMLLTLLLMVILYRGKGLSPYILMLIFTLVTSDLLVTIIKEIFCRTRPDILRLVTEKSFGFPSAHSLVSICFYGFIIYIVDKTVKSKYKYIIEYSIGLLIFLIGVSRIYLGIHYTSDVIAGFSLGFIWLMVCIYMTQRFFDTYLKR